MPITRCPQCHTAFRVVADQLRVRNGLVRCGVCATVFDGRASLEDAEAAVTPMAPAPAAPELPASAAVAVPPPAVLRGRTRAGEGGAGQPASYRRPADLREAPPRPSAAPQAPASVIRARGDDEFPAPQEPALRAEPAMDWRERRIVADAPSVLRGRGDRRQEPALGAASPPAIPARDHADDEIGNAADDAVYGDARTRYSSATDSGRAPPDFLDQDRIDARRAWGRLWTWGCLLGLLALAVQLVFAYRTAIAIAAPAMRPALTTVCQAVGCTVGYARRIERISIVSSSLRPPTGAAAQAADDGRARLVLTVVLRNRYDKEQHWPALMLDLTDLSDTVVARKAILPDAYLPAGAKGALGPGAEITLTVPIQVAGLQVNGYQLDKFFP